jgi:hypothetical protein
LEASIELRLIGFERNGHCEALLLDLGRCPAARSANDEVERVAVVRALAAEPELATLERPLGRTLGLRWLDLDPKRRAERVLRSSSVTFAYASAISSGVLPRISMKSIRTPR